jgi:hypothetical protein
MSGGYTFTTKQENRMTKQSERARAVKKLDEAFSKWVRRGERNDCFTCGKQYPSKHMHAGHFIGRTPHATRWHDKNVHPQCYHCNIQLSGNNQVYEIKIDELYGSGTADDLLTLSKTTVKYTTAELKEMTAQYERMVKEQLQ